MKKITNRAVSVLLIAALIIGGMVVYVLRYVDEGRDWALYFARANAGSTGVMIPGEIEIQRAQKIQQEGIELSDATLRDFREMSEAYGVPYVF